MLNLDDLSENTYCVKFLMCETSEKLLEILAWADAYVSRLWYWWWELLILLIALLEMRYSEWLSPVCLSVQSHDDIFVEQFRMILILRFLLFVIFKIQSTSSAVTFLRQFELIVLMWYEWKWSWSGMAPIELEKNRFLEILFALIMLLFIAIASNFYWLSAYDFANAFH